MRTSTETFLGRLKISVKTHAIPFIVLFILIVLASFLSPVFLSGENISNILLQVAVSMIVCMGMMFVIISGGIDLSVGSQVAVTSVFVAGLMRTFPLPVAIFMAVMIGGALGLTNGLIIARLKIAPFIATLGMMSFARGIAFWYTGAVPIIWSSFENVEWFFQLGGGRVLGMVPIPFILWFIIVVITSILMKYTSVGRATYAIGGNEEAVRLSGLNIANYKLFPYVYTGILCGVAGVMLTSRIGVGSPASGTGLELDAIAATVIGGTSLRGGEGTVIGVVIGVFILGIINNILNLMNVPSYPQQMLKGVIIVLAVVMSSRKSRK